MNHTATDTETTSNKTNIDKPVLSPPTPMLLLPPHTTEANSDDNSTNHASNSNQNEQTNNNTASNNNNNNTKESKTLALIEASDSTEMNLILNTIKQIFPGVNVHMCNNDEKVKKEQDNKISYLTVSRTSCSSPDCSKTNNKNSLNAKLLDNASNRESSLDNNSSIGSTSVSIERQESKDSGFWTHTKCSFESTKSLSISDHKSPNHAENHNPNSNSNTSNSNSTTSNNDNNNSTETKTSNLSAESGSINSNTNAESSDNKNYLASPRASLGYNWKKWKKGQAWRYNSSSNTNLADINTSSSANGTNNANEANNFRTTNASFNSDNSSFSIERVEDESNESYSNPNSNYFSNSFELATSKLSLMSHHQVSLQPWSSTSKLEVSSEQVETSQNSSQKRRGKLVRDRTIDTPDEQTAPQFNFLGAKESNVKFASTTNINDGETSERWLKESSPAPAGCSTPFKEKDHKQQNGRVSPPEKRLSLCFKYDENSVNSCAKEMEAEKISNILKSEEVQNAIHAALSANSKLESNDLKQIIANILSSKCFYNEELVKQIAELNTSDINLLNQPRLTSSPASSCPSPVSPLSSNLIPTVKKLSLLSPPSKPISPNNSTLNIHYDFHKDLQSKLNLKNEADDSQEDLKTTYSTFSHHHHHLQQQQYHQKGIQQVEYSKQLSPNYNKNPVLKNINSASFDFKFINNNNYLSNGLPQSASSSNNSNKAIYRSNSSPSYSSQLIDPAAQLSSPSFTKINADMTSDLIHLDQAKLNASPLGFQQQQQQQAQPPPPYFPFNFNFNKSLPQSTTNLAYTYDPHLQLQQQQQQHQQQQNKFFNDLNNFYPNFDFAKQLANNNRLIKPPAIVITESKTDNFHIDYEDAENKKIDSAFRFQSNQHNNRNDSSTNNNTIVKTENLFSTEAMIRSNEFNRSKFLANINSNNSNTFCFSQSFENALKKTPKDSKAATMPSSASSFLLNNDANYWKTAGAQSKLDVKLAANSTSSSLAASKSLKPHICPSCQKRFARSDMLIRHSRLHSGVRPYRCNRCGQEFSRSDHLNTHLRTHTGEKPYTCPHPKCSYAACRKDMITRHLKVHSKNVVNRLSLSFDSAKSPETNLTATSGVTNNSNTNAGKLLFESPLVAPNGVNSSLSLSSNAFSIMNRMETTQSFENNNNSTFKNLENFTNTKSMSSLTSF